MQVLGSLPFTKVCVKPSHPTATCCVRALSQSCPTPSWPHGLYPTSLLGSWQEYWSGLPFLPPEHLPRPGIEPASAVLQANSLQAEPSVKHNCPGGGKLIGSPLGRREGWVQTVGLWRRGLGPPQWRHPAVHEVRLPWPQGWERFSFGRETSTRGLIIDAEPAKQGW